MGVSYGKKTSYLPEYPEFIRKSGSIQNFAFEFKINSETMLSRSEYGLNANRF
jgi:hypothetical protein